MKRNEAALGTTGGMSKNFFCNIGSFEPPCVRSPVDTLESGVLFHIWWLSKQLPILYDSPPWKVALCLPYPTTPSTPQSASAGGINNYETLQQLWEVALHVSHIVDYSPSALLPSGDLSQTLMECDACLGRTFFRDADPHKSFGENLLVYHPWKVEQP